MTWLNLQSTKSALWNNYLNWRAGTNSFSIPKTAVEDAAGTRGFLALNFWICSSNNLHNSRGRTPFIMPWVCQKYLLSSSNKSNQARSLQLLMTNANRDHNHQTDLMAFITCSTPLMASLKLYKYLRSPEISAKTRFLRKLSPHFCLILTSTRSRTWLWIAASIMNIGADISRGP